MRTRDRVTVDLGVIRKAAGLPENAEIFGVRTKFGAKGDMCIQYELKPNMGIIKLTYAALADTMLRGMRLPEDSRVVRVDDCRHEQTVELAIMSCEFPPVAEGARVPVLRFDELTERWTA
jgi:hypothetical protein